MDWTTVRRLAEKSDLSEMTVAELMLRGWRYVEAFGEISRWENPMWSMKKLPPETGEGL